MERKELRGEANKPDSFENHVFDKALGIPVLLSAAPTTAGGQLRDNEVGYDSSLATADFLYIRLGAKTYKITLTEST